MTAAFLFKRVGDSLLATPALRAQKMSNPDEQIAVICEPQTVRVFSGNPHVDKIVMVRASSSLLELISTVRKLKPSRTIDFLSNPRTAITSFLSGAVDTAGIGYHLRRVLYKRVIAVQDRQQPVYSALHKLRLAAPASTDDAIEFFLSESDRAYAAEVWQQNNFYDRQVAAFFVHSRRTYKRWPLDRYARVIQFARRDLELCPLILQTPGDEASAAELRRQLDSTDAHVLAVDDLGRLAAVLKQCSVLVGNDGGPKHLAVAMGTPTLTLFGTEPWEYWTPPRDARHQVVVSPPAQATRRSLEFVTVEQVTQQLTALLGHMSVT